jgi:FkbM family methyltransferase
MWNPVMHLNSWLKSQPVLYDRMMPIKRVLLRTPTYSYLDALSRERGGRLSFIQIGANDGLRNDPVREFVVRDGWHGVFVEPLPTVFAELKKNYPGSRFAGLHFENVAVSRQDGETLEFWTFSDTFLASLTPDDRVNYVQKSSFNRTHVEEFVRHDPLGERALQRIVVPCVTASTLAARYFPDGAFDLLVIDAEGYDKIILDSIDFSRTRPRVIFFESKYLGADADGIHRRLESAGYRVRRVGERDSAAELVR